MARPVKTGLDYFPLDVNMDDKIELIEARHGIVGFGLVIKLYQIIYKNGYYFNVTEEKILVIKKRVDVNINDINDIIKDSCKWGIFDKTLFNKFSILTSSGIQERFIEATKRRKKVDFVKEYLLFKEVENMYPEAVNVNIIPINAGKSTHSKVEKSKVEKSKVEKSSSFEIFWSHYPKKKSKGQALKSWNKLIKSKQLPNISTIIESLRQLKTSKDWMKSQGDFIPHPSTWLNAAGWHDVPETSVPMVSDNLIHNATVGREWLDESE